MFADDIVLLSESATGLQNCLNALEAYCEKWNLTVNTAKTKVVIFNKGGHILKRFKFCYRNELLEITQKYCYLGIVFSSCGTFVSACKAIVEKSLKAFYKLKQLDTRNNVTLTLKLFDSLVAPVAMYGCEVWGPLILKKLNTSNFMNICETAHIEKLNIKLCKYLLGVGRKTTNAAVRGELGRYPLLLNVLVHSFKYWTRTCTLQIESLVRKSYLENLITDFNDIGSWSSCIYTLLSVFKQEKIWEYQGMMSGSTYSQAFKKDLETKYSAEWLTYIKRDNVPNKLLNYKI